MRKEGMKGIPIGPAQKLAFISYASFWQPSDELVSFAYLFPITNAFLIAEKKWKFAVYVERLWLSLLNKKNN